MSQFFTFRKSYFFLTVLFLVIEIIIASFVYDAIVRPYVGDLLVVILLYCFVRSFFKIAVPAAAFVVLLFSYLVEMLQYFDIIKKLGLQDSKLASIVIGKSFSWLDVLMYTVGTIVVLLIENLRRKRN